MQRALYVSFHEPSLEICSEGPEHAGPFRGLIYHKRPRQSLSQIDLVFIKLVLVRCVVCVGATMLEKMLF